jgi:hypothetical protein
MYYLNSRRIVTINLKDGVEGAVFCPTDEMRTQRQQLKPNTYISPLLIFIPVTFSTFLKAAFFILDFGGLLGLVLFGHA